MKGEWRTDITHKSQVPGYWFMMKACLRLHSMARRKYHYMVISISNVVLDFQIQPA